MRTRYRARTPSISTSTCTATRWRSCCTQGGGHTTTRSSATATASSSAAWRSRFSGLPRPRELLRLAGEPLEVGLVAGLDGNGEDLGNFVRVHFEEAQLEALELLGARLEQHQDFVLVVHLALPAVDGADRRKQVGAGDQLLVDEQLGDLSRLVGGG